MPTGAVPLVTAAKYGDDQTAQGLVEIMIEEAPMLKVLPWMTFEGNALKKRVEGTLPNVGFRQVNAAWTASHGSDEWSYWGVAIMGGEYIVDEFEVNVIASRDDLEADQIRKLAKATSMRFTYEFFEGTGANNGFKGIKTLISEGYGQTVTQSAGALTLDKLDEVIDSFKSYSADVILASRSHVTKVSKLGRNATGQSLIDIGDTAFGHRVVHYNGVPFIIVGQSLDSSGNVVDTLGYNEASSTSSLYFVRLSTDAVCGLMGKGGSLSVKRFGEMEAQPQRKGRLEWYPGVASFDPLGVTRYNNITNA